MANQVIHVPDGLDNPGIGILFLAAFFWFFFYLLFQLLRERGIQEKRKRAIILIQNRSRRVQSLQKALRYPALRKGGEEDERLKQEDVPKTSGNGEEDIWRERIREKARSDMELFH